MYTLHTHSFVFWFFLKLINLFIFGALGLRCCAGFLYSLLLCAGFSLPWLLLLRSTGSSCVGFSSCGSRALEHRLSSLYTVFFVFVFCFLKELLYLFIYLWLLGLRFCARAFSSCGKWGPLFIAVRGPLTIAASLVAEHRLQTRRLSSCGSRA